MFHSVFVPGSGRRGASHASCVLSVLESMEITEFFPLGTMLVLSDPETGATYSSSLDLPPCIR